MILCQISSSWFYPEADERVKPLECPLERKNILSKLKSCCFLLDFFCMSRNTDLVMALGGKVRSLKVQSKFHGSLLIIPCVSGIFKAKLMEIYPFHWQWHRPKYWQGDFFMIVLLGGRFRFPNPQGMVLWDPWIYYYKMVLATSWHLALLRNCWTCGEVGIISHAWTLTTKPPTLWEYC